MWWIGKVPTALPKTGYEGTAELRANTGARGRGGAYSLTGGAGHLAVRVEGAGRRCGRLPRGLRLGAEGEATRKVPGSFNATDTGSVGLSWVGERRLPGRGLHPPARPSTGLPGHNHGFEDCHTQGWGNASALRRPCGRRRWPRP